METVTFPPADEVYEISFEIFVLLVRRDQLAVFLRKSQDECGKLYLGVNIRLGVVQYLVIDIH